MYYHSMSIYLPLSLSIYIYIYIYVVTAAWSSFASSGHSTEDLGAGLRSSKGHGRS